MLFATKPKREVKPQVGEQPAESKRQGAKTAIPQTQVESLLEFATSEGLSPRIDAIRGVLHGVKVLGLISRNGRRYRESCIAAAAPLYEGIKVNVNHAREPRRGPRDYQDRLGCLREVRAADEGLFADLHFNPKHALAEQLIWDAEHAPENVGLSHNVEAKTSRGGNQLIVEEILRVNCVDLVADPATTAGLFESRELVSPNDIDWRQMEHILEVVRQRRPDLFQAQHPHQTANTQHHGRIDIESPQFAQLLESLDAETAAALRQERAAWFQQVYSSGKPRSRAPVTESERGIADCRSWVRRIT